MISLKYTFNRVAFGYRGPDTFWLLIWIIFILNEAEKRRERRMREAARQNRPF